MDVKIHVAVNVEQLALQGAQVVAEAAAEAIAFKGSFGLALSGGHTPEAMFETLSKKPFVSAIDWARVEIFFSDERCVPPDSPESNYGMARRTMLAKLPIPPDNIYRMRGEIDPNEAAIEYGRMLKEKFGDEGLDMVLLGMGDDGHTASLFPGTAALAEQKHRCVANFVPKFDAWRITLTAPFINRSRQVVILVGGEQKAARLAEVLEGPRDPQRLPIQLIEPTGGRLLWLLDAAAAAMDA